MTLRWVLDANEKDQRSPCTNVLTSTGLSGRKKSWMSFVLSKSRPFTQCTRPRISASSALSSSWGGAALTRSFLHKTCNLAGGGHELLYGVPSCHPLSVLRPSPSVLFGNICLTGVNSTMPLAVLTVGQALGLCVDVPWGSWVQSSNDEVCKVNMLCEERHRRLPVIRVATYPGFF